MELFKLFLKISVGPIDAVLGTLFVSVLSGKRRTGSRRWILFAALSGVLCTAVLYFGDTFAYTYLRAAVLIAVLYLQVLTDRDAAPQQKAFLPMLYGLAELIAYFVAFDFWMAPGYAPIDPTEILERNLRYAYEYSALCLLMLEEMLLICLKTGREAGGTDAKPIRRRHLLPFFLMPAAASLLQVTLTRRGFAYGLYSLEYYPAITIAMNISLLCFLSFLSFLRTIDETVKQSEMEKLFLQELGEQKRYEQMQKLYEKMQILRHDFQGHLTVLHQMIERREDRDAEQYLASLSGQVSESKRFFSTQNRVIDAVLYRIAEEHPDLVFHISGELAPVDVTAPSLAAIVGNMVENAAEAVGSLTEEEHAVYLRFDVVGDYQNITCKNKIPSPVLSGNPGLKSTKKDPDRHGFGTRSIKNAAHSCGGFAEFFEEDGFFCVHCAVPVAKKDH